MLRLALYIFLHHSRSVMWLEEPKGRFIDDEKCSSFSELMTVFCRSVSNCLSFLTVVCLCYYLFIEMRVRVVSYVVSVKG